MNAKKQKKELPSFQLFRLIINTAKTSAHIFFIFCFSFIKMLPTRTRKTCLFPFFLYVTIFLP